MTDAHSAAFDPDYEWRVTCVCGHEHRFDSEADARRYSAFALAAIHNHGGNVIERKQRTWEVVERVHA